MGAAVPKLCVSLSLSLHSLRVSLFLCLSVHQESGDLLHLVTYVCSQGISVLKAAGAGEMGLLPDFLVILSQHIRGGGEEEGIMEDGMPMLHSIGLPMQQQQT